MTKKKPAKEASCDYGETGFKLMLFIVFSLTLFWGQAPPSKIEESNSWIYALTS